MNGEHRFIEVKLPGDPIRSTQIAGLALISARLSSKNGVSVWLYNLYPEGGKPDPIPEKVHAQYKEFYKICSRRTRS